MPSERTIEVKLRQSHLHLENKGRSKIKSIIAKNPVTKDPSSTLPIFLEYNFVA